MKNTYRILRGSMGRVEVVGDEGNMKNVIYKPGQFIEMTAAEAARKTDQDGSQLELVDKEAFDAISKNKKQPASSDDNIEKMSVPKAQEYIKAITDLEVLKVVKAQEEDRDKPRKGVLTAIEFQVETLTVVETED